MGKLIKIHCIIPDRADEGKTVITAEAMKRMQKENLPLLINFDKNKRIGTAAIRLVDGNLLLECSIDSEALRSLESENIHQIDSYLPE